MRPSLSWLRRGRDPRDIAATLRLHATGGMTVFLDEPVSGSELTLIKDALRRQAEHVGVTASNDGGRG